MTSRWCAGCGEDGVCKFRCGACKAVRYCSQECQKDHWPAHKPVCGRPAPDVTDPSVKPKYDDFAVSATDIGAGNFSRVMKARHRVTGAVFALKVIEKAKIKRLSVRHKNMTNEVLMEKNALLRLRGHPNIVTLHHTFSDEAAVYYLYEMIDGGELWQQLMSEGVQVGADVAPIRFYFTQIIDALAHVHSHGLVHRDLKPENIMLTKEGVVKLVDFGTCKDTLSDALNGPEFVGTPDYMAPEVVGNGPASPASDVWALGVMLFQCAVGRTPFKAPSDYLTLRRVQMGDIVYPPGMDPQLADLCRALLAPAPGDRLGCSPTHTPTGPSFAVDHAVIRAHPFFSGPSSRLPSLAWLATAAVAVGLKTRADVCVPAAAEVAPRLPGLVCTRLAQLCWQHGCLQSPGVFGAVSATALAPLRHVGSVPYCPRETLGLTRELQGEWKEVTRVVIAVLGAVEEYTPDSHALTRLQAVVEGVNALTPAPLALILLCGDATPGSPCAAAVTAALSLLSPAVVLVPSPGAAAALGLPPVPWPHVGADAVRAVAPPPTPQAFGLWAGGVRGLALPSLLTKPESDWLSSELEIVKFGSQHTYLCSDGVWTPPEVVGALTSMASEGADPLCVSAWTSEQPLASALLASALESNVRVCVSVGPAAEDAAFGVSTLATPAKPRALRLLGKAAPEPEHEDTPASPEKAGEKEEEEEGKAAEAAAEAAPPPPDHSAVRWVTLARHAAIVLAAEEAAVTLTALLPPS